MAEVHQTREATRPGDRPAFVRARGLRLFTVVAALIFLAAHLPFLASTLDDIDSINFALGIRRFDPAEHRPHPPGYPIVIALGKLGTGVLDAVRPRATAAGPRRPPILPTPAGTAGAAAPATAPARRGNEATALAWWSALFGAVGIWPLVYLAEALHRGRRAAGSGAPPPGSAMAAAATVLLTVTCPLYWFTAVRPMSDLPGLAAALVAQALLVTAFIRQAPGGDGNGLSESPAASGRLIVAGAFAAAIALGFRSQAAWLTLPLLAAVLLDRAGRGAAAALLGSAVSFTAGVLLWAVPLIVASGGPSRYAGAVLDQARQDFSGVDMFLNFPSARRLLVGLVHTFVLPWGWTWLALVVLGFAVIGLGGLAWRRRSVVVILFAAIAPYAAFHLLVQETITTRYALPIVPAVAFLAVEGMRLVSRRVVLPVALAGVVAASLWVAVPATRAYAAAGSPLFRAIDEMERRAGSGVPGALAMHQVFARGVEAAAPAFATVLPAPPRHEWLQLAGYWQAGRRQPIWFLADPRRTDLALIDPASRRRVAFFDWPFASEQVMSGVRPDTVEWQELDPPGWFALEGWHLTPETAGVATLDGAGLGVRPIEARVRCRPGPALLMIGGRNFAGADGVPAVVDVTFDRRPVLETVVDPGPRFFLRFADLPAGALGCQAGYGRLQVSAVPPAANAGRTVNAAIEQFDVQSPGEPVMGFDEGWHEAEYSRAQGPWRWGSDRSILRIRNADTDLTLHLAGESPLRYFDRPPAVTVRAGSRVLRAFRPAADFSVDIPVPRDALEASAGTVTLETDETFVPDDRTHNGDRRRLGLRITEVHVARAGGRQ